jgi:hypothetical protein
MAHSDKYQDVLIKPGMNEAIDSRLLPMGTPRLLQNVRTRQAARFDKRPGAVDLGVSGLAPVAAAGWVAEWGGLPAMATQETVDSQLANSVYVRDESGLWNAVGRHGFVVPERRVGLAMDWGNSLRSVSCIAVNSVLYFAWGDSEDVVHLTAMDSRGVKLRETTLTSANFPRLLYTGGVIYLVYTDGATALSVRTVTPGTMALSGSSSVGTLGGSNTFFDVAPMEGGSTWVVAYNDGSGLRVRLMTGTSVTTTTDIVASQPMNISVCATSGSKVMAAYINNNTDATVASLSDSLSGAATVTVQVKTSAETDTNRNGSAVRVRDWGIGFLRHRPW